MLLCDTVSECIVCRWSSPSNLYLSSLFASVNADVLLPFMSLAVKELPEVLLQEFLKLYEAAH